MARIRIDRNKVRLQIEMTELVREQIESLRDKTQADSLSEVIRRAIAVYGFIFNEKNRGCAIIAKDSDGSEKELMFL